MEKIDVGARFKNKNTLYKEIYLYEFKLEEAIKQLTHKLYCICIMVSMWAFWSLGIIQEFIQMCSSSDWSAHRDEIVNPSINGMMFLSLVFTLMALMWDIYDIVVIKWKVWRFNNGK